MRETETKPAIAVVLDWIGCIATGLSTFLGIVAASNGGAEFAIWAAAGALSGLLLIAIATVIQQLSRIAYRLGNLAEVQPPTESDRVESEEAASC